MFKWFEKIKEWYPNYWGKTAVRNAVIKKKITAEEYKQITGEEF